jgi:predicted HD superfamily hydrolase involved in NAD metabolism
MPDHSPSPTSALLASLCLDIPLTGDVLQDVPLFLNHHRCSNTIQHSQQVAFEAQRIALSASVDSKKAEIAGWLHDISAVFPAPDRAIIARKLGLEVLAEEDRCPMIVHQKLSRLMAWEIFDVTDPLILDAVGCHTTLRAHSTTLDKVLFVADKIAWDSKGTPPYATALQAALDESLDHAVRYFLTYLWERRQSLQVIHPWLREAYQALPSTLSSEHNPKETHLTP